MDAQHLDALARRLAVPTTRRATAHALAVGLVLMGRERRDVAATDPKDPCHHLHDATRGQPCTRNCNCKGDYQCGTPRTTEAERQVCGQRNVSHVCCRGQGDTCHGNDCECCGALECLKGRCAQCTVAADCPTPPDPCQEAVCERQRCKTRTRAHGAACGPGKVCSRGTCLGNGLCPAGSAFTEDCGSERCGLETHCLPTAEGGLTCVKIPSNNPGRVCKHSTDCPATEVCLQLGPDAGLHRCARVCAS